MTNDNKYPMFGHTYTFDLTSHFPRAGKSSLVNELMAEFVEKSKTVADTNRKENSMHLTANQALLAKMKSGSLTDATSPQSPQLALLDAVDEAIADGKDRLGAMVRLGSEGSCAYQDLHQKVDRWEQAKRRNR
ncbi:MAG: hypothetical protein H7315_15270 [Herminiimonas sp.]|nr:hypothetical protein [Herminiimonas sp.]